MKKILIMISLASLCLSAFGSDKAALICKTKIKSKDLQAKEGQVGKIRITKSSDGAGLDLKVSEIAVIHSKKEIEYMNEETSQLDSELYNSKVGKFGFKSVSAAQALSTNSHFVYLNKKGLSNIQAVVIDRATGERAILEKCHQPKNFFSRLLKQ